MNDLDPLAASECGGWLAFAGHLFGRDLANPDYGVREWLEDDYAYIYRGYVREVGIGARAVFVSCRSYARGAVPATIFSEWSPGRYRGAKHWEPVTDDERAAALAEYEVRA